MHWSLSEDLPRASAVSCECSKNKNGWGTRFITYSLPRLCVLFKIKIFRRKLYYLVFGSWFLNLFCDIIVVYANCRSDKNWVVSTNNPNPLVGLHTTSKVQQETIHICLQTHSSSKRYEGLEGPIQRRFRTRSEIISEFLSEVISEVQLWIYVWIFFWSFHNFMNFFRKNKHLRNSTTSIRWPPTPPPPVAKVSFRRCLTFDIVPYPHGGRFYFHLSEVKVRKNCDFHPCQVIKIGLKVQASFYENTWKILKIWTDQNRPTIIMRKLI